jgi:hypothetical protein
MSFTEDEVEQCVLLKHRIMKLLKDHSDDVGFSVILTILMKSVAHKRNKKEDVMDAISQSWDKHMRNIEEA